MFSFFVKWEFIFGIPFGVNVKEAKIINLINIFARNFDEDVY